MARPPQITPEILAPLIRAHGPVSATDLATLLRVNRTTIVRGLSGFGEELVTFGATRSTRYILRRQVMAAGNTWPIYVIDKGGRAKLWATLEAFHDRLWRIVWAETPPLWAERFSDSNGLWQGFPFFLADIRPQGFLGRTVARRISGLLGVPEDPRQWSDDHTVLFLRAAGDYMPGALILGDDCLRRAQARSQSPEPEQVVRESERADRYPLLAESAMTSLPGSSAGGEQPKFLISLCDSDVEDRHPVLVKFSPPLDQPTGRRWADLMVCECLALEVLAERGLAKSGVRILDAGGRRFLEVPRFDREGSRGRRGVVTLSALHPASDGYNSRIAWPTAATELLHDDLIDSETRDQIVVLHAFGELIGNTDMHAGNLAFWLEEGLPFRLAPAYDMLPMLWAPGPQGEIVDRSFVPVPPLPAARSLWREATEWASDFWERVINDVRISEEFAVYAQDAADSVKRVLDSEK